MDAGIQVRDGNLMVPYVLDLAPFPAHRLPSGRWSVALGIPTLERGNEEKTKMK